MHRAGGTEKRGCEVPAHGGHTVVSTGRPGRRPARRRLARLVGTGSLAALIAASAAVTTGPPPAGARSACSPTAPAGCTLAKLAKALHIRIGTTVSASRLSDSAYTATLAREFTAVTPENDFKWYAVQPAPGVWHFENADADLQFARANHLALKGHNLIWDQDTYTPSWVTALDAAALQSAVATEITTEVHRYKGKVKRWDVVNEPLATLGTASAGSVFDRELGPGWIAWAFGLAHAADPKAELWLNEYGTDWVPGKFDALVALVQGLQAAGTPLTGVGLETHRLSATGPDTATLVGQMQTLAALGLQVSLSEVDVPVPPDAPTALTDQADAYGRIVGACLQVSACRELTVWGLDDGHTWLDHLGLFPTPTRPLLFDSSLQPKPAYSAVRDCLARALGTTRGVTGSLPACAGS